MGSCLKKTHHKKRAGDVAQVIEHLPSECEELSSNPSTTHTQKVSVHPSQHCGNDCRRAPGLTGPEVLG
jgi:hypothetical protein